MTKEFNILVHSFPLFSSSPAQREGGTTERRSRRERRPEEAGDVREERSVSGPYRRSSVHSLLSSREPEAGVARAGGPHERREWRVT